jgi:hypothetical protein
MVVAPSDVVWSRHLYALRKSRDGALLTGLALNLDPPQDRENDPGRVEATLVMSDAKILVQ